ncbi:MAG: condensation domain-containing protein, partial [Patescibacteria group bacterium]|nr:condensation domain-containing protein [Patescibacteria group bacterium]
ECPMTCVTQVRLSGSLDRAAFSEAFRDVLRKHPLLNATVARSRRGSPCWMPTDERSAEVEWNATGDGDVVRVTDRINLESEVGMRFRVRQDSNGAVATMFFHHACSDGIGAARFFEDLLIGYHARLEGGSPQAPDVSQLPLRGQVPRIGRFPARLANEMRTLVCEGRQWLFHPVTPLGCRDRQPLAASDESLEDVPTHAYDAAVLSQLLAVARSRGVTLNDVLLAALFRTADQWNDRYPPSRQTPWFRIAVPQNLRVAADRWMPAANKVTMCFMTRARSACDRSDVLLKGIGSEMAAAKHWLRGKGLLRAMRLAQAIPWLRHVFLASDPCLATVVLSNLGDYGRWFCDSLPRDGAFTRAGNLRVESILSLPPVRPNTHAAFCAASYGGIFRISLRRDPRCLSRADALELLALYVSQIARLLQECPCRADVRAS